MIEVNERSIKEVTMFYRDSIRTYTGKYINVTEPAVEDFCIEDIAHALSLMPRFGGHTKRFYSVAQHSICCMHAVSQEHKLAALMHDASEAYLMDVPSPLKRWLTNYKLIESSFMMKISKKFGFQYPFSKEVQYADEAQLQFEWENIVLDDTMSDSFDYFTNDEVEEVFLYDFHQLTK